MDSTWRASGKRPRQAAEQHKMLHHDAGCLVPTRGAQGSHHLCQAEVQPACSLWMGTMASSMPLHYDGHRPLPDGHLASSGWAQASSSRKRASVGRNVFDQYLEAAVSMHCDKYTASLKPLPCGGHLSTARERLSVATSTGRPAACKKADR